MSKFFKRMTAGFLAGIMVVAGGVYATSSNYIVHAEEVQEEEMFETRGGEERPDKPGEEGPLTGPGRPLPPQPPKCGDCGALIDPFRPCTCRPIGPLGFAKIELE